jgi:hypothetical protein
MHPGNKADRTDKLAIDDSRRRRTKLLEKYNTTPGAPSVEGNLS